MYANAEDDVGDSAAVKDIKGKVRNQFDKFFMVDDQGVVYRTQEAEDYFKNYSAPTFGKLSSDEQIQIMHDRVHGMNKMSLSAKKRLKEYVNFKKTQMEKKRNLTSS